MDPRESTAFIAELDGHTLGALCAVTMALLANRLDLCIQGLFGAGKSKSMAILLQSLLELDDERKLKILFMCKENTGTPFAALLWVDTLACSTIGRLVGDEERNKSSYTSSPFDINPKERRQMVSKCQLLLITGAHHTMVGP